MRKAFVPFKHGVGKKLKKIRSMMLKPKSTSGTKKPDAYLIELP